MQNQNTANQMLLDMGRTEFGGNFNNMDFFWYRAPSFVINSTIPAVTNNIQIDASANFLWIATTYQASIVADGVVLGALVTEATNVIPLVNLQIADTGSGKFMSNLPIPLAAFAGDGKNPYRLVKPRIFGKNATIGLNWSPFVVAGTNYRIDFVLHGYKVYN